MLSTKTFEAQEAFRVLYSTVPSTGLTSISLALTPCLLSRFLLSLPTEIATQIFMMLDLRSIATFVETCPEFAKFFLIIMDIPFGQHYPPFLLCHSGIKYTRLDCFNPQDYGRPPIKIFLLTHRKSIRDACSASGSPSGVARYIDKFSFVCVSSLLGLRVNSHKLGSGAMTHFETFTCETELLTYTDARHLSRRSSDFNKMKSLHIRYSECIENLTVDSLKQLTISFGKTINRPVIRNINANSLEFMKVSYYDHFPIFENISVGPQVVTSSKALGVGEFCFELIHVPSAPRGLHTPAQRCLTTLAEMAATDMSFTKKFPSYIITGGHDCILDLVDFTTTHHLWWKRATTQDKNATPIKRLTIPDLQCLQFHTLFANDRVPKITSSQLSAVSISTSSVGLNLNRIFRHSRLMIIMLHVPAQGMTLTSKEQWDPYLETLRWVKLDGVAVERNNRGYRFLEGLKRNEKLRFLCEVIES